MLTVAYLGVLSRVILLITFKGDKTKLVSLRGLSKVTRFASLGSRNSSLGLVIYTHSVLLQPPAFFADRSTLPRNNGLLPIPDSHRSFRRDVSGARMALLSGLPGFLVQFEF